MAESVRDIVCWIISRRVRVLISIPAVFIASLRSGSSSFVFLSSAAMSFFRHLLLRSLRGGSVSELRSPRHLAAISTPSRHFAFSSAEEAAAERRRRKRRLRIEPPLHALRRDPNAPRPPRDPNAPRLPDSTSALVGPRLNLHNRVQSLIRGGDLDAASSTARHAVFSSVRPTVFTCNAITASMLRAGRIDDVVALFTFFFNQSNIVPNVVSYNILINAHCNAGRVDVALDVYRHILENAPFSPSYVTYRHLTKGLVDADRMQDAIDLLREMLNRGHGADSMVYNTLMAGFIDRQNMERALQFFDELRDRCLVYDGIVHSTLMEAYFKRGMDKEAMDSYQSLLDRQFKMTPATCNVLIETLLRHHKLAEAEAMFESMLNNHSPPSFTAINTDTYNLMVNQRFKEGKIIEAIETFHRQPRKPVIMDVGCFNNIIGKLCANGLLPESEKLFGEMPEKSVNPDATTYRTLIDACFSVGRTDSALEYFEKMIKSSGESPGFRVDVGVYNMMFHGLVSAGRINQAMEVFGKMWERGIRPNQSSYEVLITAMCNEGNLDRGRELFEQMLRDRINATPEFSAFLLDAFGKAGRIQEIEELVGGSPSNVTSQAQQLHIFGILGCALCVVGSTTIVLHAPQERAIESVTEVWDLATEPAALILVFRFAPQYGQTHIMVYIGICSLVGSLSVMSVKALGIALKLTFSGMNQLNYPQTWALDTFNTAVVSPIYYVMFTSLTILASVIMFKDWDRQKPTQIVTEMCGFVTILSGTFLLHRTKDMVDGSHHSSRLSKHANEDDDYSSDGIPLKSPDSFWQP
ncbi:hypothetical protein ZIOFF_032542 [Zingiber officinale]|uniref:Pentatricopeptide repeat-containing protein n=1 Tax=Zingiber officinale TaxID=94328 RepID=A0A8J5LBN4_ZINOF|nr:hypothetical protein ZIOFF_032542 [Zingiber officinale]